MAIEHHVEIQRAQTDVFDFVADARHDPVWCKRVISCVQREGDGPAVGARYEALHRPIPGPARRRQIEIVAFDPPTAIRWIQEDGNGVFDIIYLLTPTDFGTRFTQRDQIEWKIPRWIVPLAERRVNSNIAAQQQQLMQVLE
jgi:hypothetical protein